MSLKLPTDAIHALSEWETPIDQRIHELEQQLIEIRRHLHAYPEPSREEYETSKYLASQLSEAGIPAKLARDGLGVIANLDIGEPDSNTPRIAIRADIDALRISDAKTTPYASKKPGICHACGHDAHAAIALGTALSMKAFAQTNETLPAETSGLKLRFIFQPAEETSDGGHWMVEQGAVDECAAILGCHVDPERPLGTVGIRYGTMTANCDEVEIVVEGRGGHSARPHHTSDPIAAAAHLVTSLYEFLPRSIDARHPAVFSVGMIQGGTLPNVIPDRVLIKGSLRSLHTQTRTCLKDRIEEIVHGAKEASGAMMHLRFFEAIDSVVNDPFVTKALEESSRRVLGDEGIQMIEEPSMGGEDFSAYLKRIPGAMFRLGIAPPGFQAPFLHASDFDIDERALSIGVRILLRTAVLLTTAMNPHGSIDPS